MNAQIDIHAKHLVLGFGPTGLSLVNALKHLGVSYITAMDTRLTPPHLNEITMQCKHTHIGGFAANLLAECDYLWLSPGVPLATPELQATLARLPKNNVGGDIELFARLVTSKDRVFAITGTNGKSTVTTLLGDIFTYAGFNTYVGGNLGEPALDLWRRAEYDKNKIQSQPTIFVLELSSFQLETTTHLPVEVGAILNIEPDHLDRYRNFEHYCDTKLKLFQQSGKWVSNHDDPILKDYINKTVSDRNQNHTSPLVCYSEFSLIQNYNHCDWWINHTTSPRAIYYKNTPFMALDLIPIGGLHNVANVMAASAMATLAAIDAAQIRKAVIQFKSLPHRCVLVRTLKGVRYYNDSKATNLPSTIAAISGFSEPKWLILGGVTKDQDFSILSNVLNASIKKILLIGKDVSQILPHIPPTISFEYVVTLEAAIEDIHQHARAGDVVLFSPACASFDQFTNYNVRGDFFIKLTHQLSE